MLLSSRRVLANTSSIRRSFSTKSSITKVVPPTDPAVNPDIDTTNKNTVEIYTEKIGAIDKHMVWGLTAPEPDPVLPDNPAEIAALDTAHNYDPRGPKRHVRIVQGQKSASQSPYTAEQTWSISFASNGEVGETWTNPLMGWVSGADTMASQMSQTLNFRNAKEAVYFAKKRGWTYVVEEPIIRVERDDGAQYQDNFLPQDVALKVTIEKTKCAHWSREESGASHYFRPLKYHGDGCVPQYGTNPKQETAPDCKGSYKMR